MYVRISLSILLVAGGCVLNAFIRTTEVSASAPSPSWWNGQTCDTNRYPGSYQLSPSATYNGVVACGPGPLQGGVDHLVNFGAGVSEYEWECVELSMRYMYLVYGIVPYILSGNAATIVGDYSGTRLTKVTNSGSSLPAPGDILAENVGSYGHTAIVTAVNVSGGNGTVTILQQNVTGNNGIGTITVSGNILGSNVTGWLHNPVAVDTDGDGTPDPSDLLPDVPGPANNRGVPLQTSQLSGDFNGDGKQDIMEMYDYGSARTKFLVHYGDGAGGFAWPQVAWDSGPGNWEWNKIKPIVGDFNGDGKSDIAAFYDYGNNRVVLWELMGTATGLSTPVMQWDSGTGMWTWSRINPIVGDFNGDGKQDIIHIYDYGSAQTKFLVFYGTGTGGFAWPQVAWDSGPGNWEWQKLKTVTGDFDKDGKTDAAVFYDYGNNRVVLWELVGTSTGLATSGIKWDSGYGMWTWSRIRVLTGDFNGDGNMDTVHVYDYGNAQTKFIVFYGNGLGGFAAPQVAWDSGPGNWQWFRLKPTVGDFTSDGKSDIGVFYDYGNAQVKLWELVGLPTSIGVGGIKWDSGTGMWNWNLILVP